MNRQGSDESPLFVEFGSVCSPRNGCRRMAPGRFRWGATTPCSSFQQPGVRLSGGCCVRVTSPAYGKRTSQAFCALRTRAEKKRQASRSVLTTVPEEIIGVIFAENPPGRRLIAPFPIEPRRPRQRSQSQYQTQRKKASTDAASACHTNIVRLPARAGGEGNRPSDVILTDRKIRCQSRNPLSKLERSSACFGNLVNRRAQMIHYRWFFLMERGY